MQALKRKRSEPEEAANVKRRAVDSSALSTADPQITAPRRLALDGLCTEDSEYELLHKKNAKYRIELSRLAMSLPT